MILTDPFPHLKSLARAWRAVYGPLPDDYTAFDLEADPRHDLILQLGYCTVRNRVPVERVSLRLGWEALLPPDKLSLYNARVAKLTDRPGVRRWLTKPGVDPRDAVGRFAAVLAANPVVVTYNGWRFDAPVFGREAAALGVAVAFRDTAHIDAGAFVKAAQTGAYPRPGETYRAYAERALRSGGPRVRWSLERFWAKAAAFALPPGEEFHDAWTDAYATHKVIEWVRRAGE